MSATTAGTENPTSESYKQYTVICNTLSIDVLNRAPLDGRNTRAGFSVSIDCHTKINMPENYSILFRGRQVWLCFFIICEVPQQCTDKTVFNHIEAPSNRNQVVMIKLSLVGGIGYRPKHCSSTSFI